MGLKIKTGGITPPSPSNCTERAFARLIYSISTITLALQIYNLLFYQQNFLQKIMTIKEFSHNLSDFTSIREVA